MTRTCGKRVEILDERSEVSQTFVNPDGTQTVEESIEPVRVKHGTHWVPIDTTLKATATGVKPRAAALPTTLSGGGDGPLARLRDGSNEISFSWPGTLPKPVLRGNIALYRNVLPDVDLQVVVDALGFSELLIVRTREAATDGRLDSLNFGLATKGVKVRATGQGGLAATDKGGRTVFTAPAPLMWDASIASAGGDTAKGEPAMKKADRKSAKPAGRRDTVAAMDRRVVMPMTVSKDTLTLRPDRKLLADPDTKYPVYIDPSVTGAISGSAWTSVWSKHKSSSFWKNSSALTNGSTYGSAGAGRTEDCSGCSDHVVRSFFRMDTSKVRKKQILSATFRVEQRHAWTCNPKSNAKLWMIGGISTSTTWNNQPNWYSGYTAQTAANRKAGAAHGCSGAGTIEFNATSMVAKAAASNWTTLNLGLRAVDEGTLKHWKRFNHSSPKLAITYNTAPAAPGNRNSDAKGCATGAARPYVRTLTPTLAAQQVDPDNDQGLTTSFYWWQSGSARSESNKVSQAAGNKTTVAKVIPAGRLADGRTYVWQARTADKHATGAFSATCEFAVDVTAPAGPSAVASPDYPAGTPGGGVGVSGQFTISPPASGATDLAGYAWTLDQGVQASAAKQIAASPGQSVTVPYVPLRDGVQTMRVWTKDKAGWYSAAPLTYSFTVRAGTGPAGQWSFDDAGDTTTDDSGHNNTLALASGVTRPTGRGGVGSALLLNGLTGAATLAGPITAPHPTTGAATPVRTDTSFTVAARVRLTTTSGLTGQHTAVAAFGNRASAYTLGYSAADNKWRFTMAGADADNPALFSVLSNAGPVAGKWTHLAAAYDASTKRLTLYVDGTAQTATATLTGGFNAAAGFAVGKRRWNGGDDGFLNGAVDDVRVYSFIPAVAKITELAAPLPPAVTLPGGDSVPVGAAASAVIGSGGDTNIVSYRYSINSTTLNLTATPPAAGGSVTIPLTTATGGAVTVYALAVDSGGRVSPTPGIVQLSVIHPATLSGFVTDADFNPLPGAVVRLDPGGVTATAAADGAYTVAGFPSGTYTVTGTSGGVCGLSGRAEDVEVTGESYLDLVLTPVADGLGYTCDTRAQVFSPADQSVVALTGDNAVATVTLPFAFPFYGQAFRSAWVDTNGILSFTDPGGSHPYDGGALPSAANPNAMIAPFWDDLVIDSSASVRTTTTGSGSTATFAIEWRNAHRKAATSQRVSFTALLSADGTVTTNYTGLDTDAEKGASAAVGIAAPAAEDGLTFSRNTPALANGQAVVFQQSEGGEGALEVHSLSGRVLDMTGNGISGARVSLDPSGMQTTTSSDGTYRFEGLVSDTYTVFSAQNQKCPQVAKDTVELTADTVRDLRRGLDYGGMGYVCAQGPGNFVPAANVLALTGDDATTALTLPFAMPFHGRTYTSATVSTNGFLTFDTALGADTYVNPAMPTAAAPNAVVAPFWDDLEIDASASVRTQTTGTAPNRKFVIEWRNAKFRPNGPDRITFEAVFGEAGDIVFNYGTLTTTLQQGAAATIGIENASGTVATLFSFQEARVNSTGAITFTPAAPGIVRGTTTVAVTGGPAAGRTVTLNPGGRTAVTDANGGYQFTGVPVGEYTVQVSTGDSRCPGQYAKEIINFAGGTKDVDLSVMTDGDEFGYRCDTGATTYVPGDITEDWQGDETVWQKNPPFPIKLYGESYTSAWISANGLVSFKDPMFFGWIGSIPSALPSPAVPGSPNAAVYVHWDDWVVDASSKIATKSSGSAPNRQWVVEWRNVYLHPDTTARASFEAIFSENGDITFAYKDITDSHPVERGSGASTGIENASGTIGFQSLYREPLLASGQGVTFRPNPPGAGSITGTVTCEGAGVGGATVAAAGQSTTTAADGSYRIDNVPAGTYAVIATRTGGACAGSAVANVTVGTGTLAEADFAGLSTPAGAGYRLSERAVAYTPADGAVLPVTGDEDYEPVPLPFPVNLYGQTYATGYVDGNGLIAFQDPGTPSSDAWPIPSPRNPEEPNAAVYPFWHDWVVDSDASVRTATRGAAPSRQFVVEWRNVSSYEDPTTRTTFQVAFDEAGGWSFSYPDMDGTFLTKGGGATIGIENADGTVALQYTYRQPVLRPGTGLRFDPPQ
ncbi:carboxypeptidase regulatory-like domain-containing protein [Jidongwangia harbinensis]|uniref:carboxypeptidase regulatory-like domain-containing protein n=1 Tax=Jidongwangia harbinensis TaxID=2878561 RepID=UPI001CD99A56|nr:carboxypeptidase regulatory-like domain-containing protein [Jidongwangia harbinensis]MCA2218228.1 carboxypeptidase regulatory-like domain-containing protein [Jidongwangia harbinensis]